MDTHTTPVCFRHDGQEVTAVFPFERHAAHYGCYAHVGQHSTCSREWALGSTRPATPEEYKSLKAELEADPYGYRLEVRNTWPRGA